jgi:hypothetical protein
MELDALEINFFYFRTMKHEHSLNYVCSCRTRVRVVHRRDTDTYGYIELCHSLKLLLVSMCQRLCRVCACVCAS